MTKQNDLSESPQWFIDLFLSAYSSAKEQKERVKSAGIFLIKDETPEGDLLVGSGLLQDSGNLLFMGRREPSKEGREIEHVKYETEFLDGKN
jgi:hypothetical protein